MSSTAAQLEKIVRRCRRANRGDELAQEEARQQARYLNTYFDDAGMLVLDGRLPPEAGLRRVRDLIGEQGVGGDVSGVAWRAAGPWRR